MLSPLRSEANQPSDFMRPRRSLLALTVCLPLATFLTVALAAETEGTKAEAVWVFDLKEGDDAIPRGKVFLEVNGKRTLILDDAIGNFAVTERGTYGTHQVPETALTACSGSWAGTKERLYAVRKGAKVQVFQRTESSEDPTDGGIGKYKLVKTVAVK
jgi:hypothetical protein